jgi:hypothetical protein
VVDLVALKNRCTIALYSPNGFSLARISPLMRFILQLPWLSLSFVSNHFYCALSPAPLSRYNGFLFNNISYNRKLRCSHMKRKTALLVTEDDLLVDLAFHNVPASLLIEFSQKIIRPYYNGNLTAAIKDLIQKALTDQNLVQSHINHSQN